MLEIMIFSMNSKCEGIFVFFDLTNVKNVSFYFIYSILQTTIEVYRSVTCMYTLMSPSQIQCLLHVSTNTNDGLIFILIKTN